MLLRHGYDVWTYDTPKHVRYRTEWLFAQGWRSIILACASICRVYEARTATTQALQDRIDTLGYTPDDTL